jgi:hypothetical protein
VFISSRAAALAAEAAALAAKEAADKVERAMAEMKATQERETAAAEQKRRDAEAIAGGAEELNAMFEKAQSHLIAGAATGGGAAAANHVENVVELDELLLGLCDQTEKLVKRVPQLKSIGKVVEPCLQRLLEAINRNREECSPVWLDDATPSTRASFNRCRPQHLSHQLQPIHIIAQHTERLATAGDGSLR